MASTSRKRRRRCVSVHPEEGRLRCFFVSLPEEALENIIRHVSRRPRHNDWVLFVPPKDILTLFRCDNPLSRVAKRLIWQLDMRTFSQVDQEDCVPWVSPGEESLLSSILAEGAESFKEIYIDNYIPFEFRGTLCPRFPKLKREGKGQRPRTIALQETAGKQ